MLDCLGKELNIGDEVICSDNKYADLLVGEVIGFTPKKARIKYTRTIQNTEGISLKESYQICKIEKIVHAHWNPDTEYYDDAWSEVNVRHIYRCSRCGCKSDWEALHCVCGARMDEKVKYDN